MLFWLGDFGLQLGEFGLLFPQVFLYRVVCQCHKHNVIKKLSLRSHQLLNNIRFQLFRYVICSLVESVRA